jgi:hypothetical protein
MPASLLTLTFRSLPLSDKPATPGSRPGQLTLSRLSLSTDFGNPTPAIEVMMQSLRAERTRTHSATLRRLFREFAQMSLACPASISLAQAKLRTGNSVARSAAHTIRRNWAGDDHNHRRRSRRNLPRRAPGWPRHRGQPLARGLHAAGPRRDGPSLGRRLGRNARRWFYRDRICLPQRRPRPSSKPNGRLLQQPANA